MVWALPLIFAACPGVAVEVGTKHVSEAASQSIERPAAFRDFQRILRGYPDLVIDARSKEMMRDAGKTPEQFAKDVAAYELKENEWGYFEEEEGDYARLVQEMKLLRRAVERISLTAEVLHDSLLRFSRMSVQTALQHEAHMDGCKLTPETAEKSCRDFSLEMLRMFAQDLLAFRCHASWLDEDVQGESPNRAPRSIAVSQYLSCSGNNAEIVMYTEAARRLWTRQVEMEEGDLFVLSDSEENGDARYTDPLSRYEWSAPRNKAEKDLATMQHEWTVVKSAYADYLNAWEQAYAPVPGSSGSGAPYWCADMCMHMLSHWEQLVSCMLFRNRAEIPEVNMDCFLLSLPGNAADEFAEIYINTLSDAVKQLTDEDERTAAETETENLRERVARLYDARMRYALASISCEFHGDEDRIAVETEKARLLIQEKMLQDITVLGSNCAENSEEDKQQDVHASPVGLTLRRQQMRLLVTQIGKSYEFSINPEPFSGEKNFRAPSFSDTHVKRIQDLLEETDEAWNCYRSGWNNLLCSLPDVDHDILEHHLHAHREQWLYFLFSRAFD